MGHLKDIANQRNIQTFPGATYEASGDIPPAQCSEARIEGIHGGTAAGFNLLTETAAFTGFALAGKTLTIIAPPGNAGDYNITANTPDIVFFNPLTPVGSNFNEWYVHDGGALILTRNIQSLFRYYQEYFDVQQSATGAIAIGLPTITDPGKFPQDFSGFVVDVLNPPPPDRGSFIILSNTLNVLTTDHTFTINKANTAYDVHIPNPQGATIKGGTLYTTAPEAITEKACTILFAPLT